MARVWVRDPVPHAEVLQERGIDMDSLEPIAVMPHLWIVPLVGVVLAAVGFAFVFAAKRAMKRDRYMSESVYFVSAVLAWVFSALTLVTAVLLLMPFDGKYHQFFHTSGEVVSVTNSFAEADGEISAVPVVVIGGIDQPVAVDDSRILKMQGEVVDLTCTISWVPYGRDRINCFIAG